MLLNKDLQITVFKVDNDVFEQLGDLSQYTSAILPDEFNGCGNFELFAPIMDGNSELLKKGNIIWTGGESGYLIEIVKSTFDEKGEKKYHVKGRTLECILCDRILWGGYIKTGFTSTVMYDIVNKNCVNPTNQNRKIPWLYLSQDSEIGKRVTYQQTGGEVYDSLKNLATNSDLGFSVIFDPRNKKMIFEVREGVDRTIDNTEGNEPVLFSTELEDILSSSYYSNSEDLKTMALVQGEDKGDERKYTTTGATLGAGFNRKELYVDARDLQSEVYNADGTITELTDEQYISTLKQRGNEKLSEHIVTETFDAKIRQFGDVQYVFGVDYFKGDKVTVVDRQLMVQVSARITSVEEDFGEEYSLILTFGYSYPTLLTKVKRAIS